MWQRLSEEQRPWWALGRADLCKGAFLEAQRCPWKWLQPRELPWAEAGILNGAFRGNLGTADEQRVVFLFLDMLETLSQAEYCICSTSLC